MLAEHGVAVRDLRVRDLGERGARLELDAAALAALDDGVRDAVAAAVRGEGFAACEVDPQGFRSGAMNELLADPARFR